MILRYQRIQEQIHEKCTSLITGLEPELELVGDTAGMAGSMVGSRTATPNVLLEVATGGLGVIENLGNLINYLAHSCKGEL
jgi:hypothetical protein